ncbi:MAG: hypothetical protein IT428_30870 [Planctomycetaceae bacterium]|nr:hypothetical protein [Planctomycetaceae bacterium]
MLEFLATEAPDVDFVPVTPWYGRHFLLWFLFYSAGTAVFSLVSIVFWIWMAVHCIRNEPDRQFWLWIMVLFPPSSLAYFIARWLPGNEIRLPNGVRRAFRGNELQRLEMATLQIGNPHQFIQYGDALREVGRNDQAHAAYLKALERDPDSVQALWGAASVDLECRRFLEAKERLRQVLAIDPQYKFGDVSLAFGRALIETQDYDGALDHMQKHIQRWRQPEALYLLACLEAQMGRYDASRVTLQQLLMDVNSCPTPIARRYGVWKSKAQKMLKKLPA